jgi:peptidoglycan/LPS O-acetylase OafA/YrhL
LVRLSPEAPKPPFAVLPILILTLAASILLLRTYTVLTRPFDYNTNIFATHMRMDSLLFGVLLSYLYRFESGFKIICARYRAQFIGLGLLLLAPPFIWELEAPFHYSVGFTLYYIGSGLILSAMVCSAPIENKLLLAIAKVGTYSYSIYLWHPTMRYLFLPLMQKYLHLGTGPLTSLLIYVLGSVGVGIAMSKLVELPALRLRDKLIRPASSRIREVSESRAA